MERRNVERRPDDYTARRAHLVELDDEQLQERFWELADRLVRPLVELAENHTSPSIERSVLLRMGFSGDEAGRLVEAIADRGLLGKGAGNVVLRAAGSMDLEVRPAAEELLEGRGWDAVEASFDGGGADSC